MAKRSKKPRDTNSLAAAIVNQATDPDNHGDDPYEGKDPAAVHHGRKGGKIGGKARAERLSPERRSEIASKAAATRWERSE
ncbi:MAG: hypothetical protein R2695_19965 [Acidimicrobiales bacterium]